MKGYITEKVVIIDTASDHRWDRFVEDHPFGWLCHLSGWKGALEKSFKHMKGYYLAILKNDSIQAALPLFEVRSWLIGKRLVSPPLATLCDPLISTEDDIKALLEAVTKLMNYLGVSFVELRTHKSHSLIENSFLYINRHYKHHYILLGKNPEDLMKSFDRTCVRQKISRAIKNDINLKDCFNESDLKSFYRLYFMTRKRRGLPPQPYKFIKTIWEEFSPSRKITLLLAEHKKQPIAGLMLFKFKNRVSAEYSVADNNFYNLSPNHFLFWNAIKSANHEGFKIFDFGRTSSNNVSLINFKKRWGTKVADLPDFYYPKDAFKQTCEREKSISYKILNKICYNSPDFALKILGNFIYRHF